MRARDLMILGVGLIALAGGVLAGVGAVRGDNITLISGSLVLISAAASLMALTSTKEAE